MESAVKGQLAHRARRLICSRGQRSKRLWFIFLLLFLFSTLDDRKGEHLHQT